MVRKNKKQRGRIEPIKIKSLNKIPFRLENTDNECRCVNQICDYYYKRNCTSIKTNR